MFLIVGLMLNEFNLQGLIGGHWNALLLLLATTPNIDAIVFLTKSITGPRSILGNDPVPVVGM